MDSKIEKYNNYIFCIYRNNNYKEYADIIIDLYLDNEKYKKIGQYSLKRRQENNFSTDVLSKNLSKIMELDSDKSDIRKNKINIPFRERLKDLHFMERYFIKYI